MTKRIDTAPEKNKAKIVKNKAKIVKYSTILYIGIILILHIIVSGIEFVSRDTAACEGRTDSYYGGQDFFSCIEGNGTFTGELIANSPFLLWGILFGICLGLIILSLTKLMYL